MRTLIFLIPLLVFLVLAGYFAVGLNRDPNLVPSALIDQPVPTFSLPGLPGQGAGLASADLHGRAQIVNVFASWCAPCRVEHPMLVRLARENGVLVRGIDYKDRPEDAAAWLSQMGNPYQGIGADTDGRVAIDWGVYGVPETYVIDRQGRIRYKQVGPLTAADIDGKILPLLKELQG
ncbi:MAG: DsbE family thiol:disulfide interchange protein [Azospirillaceae bacterium]|nr:DsbE family thiol:disulfide interchange protein [Azospirillaceae bacterium]